ncbi:hypothetical protein MBLNU13_g10295t2 [Cladosporium sp. NU13]
MPRFFVTRHWQYARIMYAFFVVEFLLTVAVLTLYGIADPNTYRTRLWQNGADAGFNSDPSIYVCSEIEEMSSSVQASQLTHHSTTTFNIAISVLGMFILLCKVVMFIMHLFLPLLAFFVHGLMLALYAVSLRNQSAPDMSDPDKPSPGLPWYMSKGCSYATPSNKGFCMQARASFGVTCAMVAFFAIFLIYSALSIIPTQRERSARAETIEMAKLSEYRPQTMTRDEQRDMNRQIFLNLPKTPTTPWGRDPSNPMTPRTVAFTQLNGGAQGGYHGTPQMVGSGQGPSRLLPFRQQYGDGLDGR